MKGRTSTSLDPLDSPSVTQVCDASADTATVFFGTTAFLAAVQNGDFEALVAVLDPAIVLQADGGAAKGMSRLVRGLRRSWPQAAAFSKLGLSNQVLSRLDPSAIEPALLAQQHWR